MDWYSGYVNWLIDYGCIGGSMVAILLAIFTGILITVVPIMNGQNALHIGTLKTSFFHYTFAFMFGVMSLLLLTPMAQIQHFSRVSPYYYSGGVIGLSLILLMNFYSVRIKALYIAVLPFLGQMLMGFILDVFFFDTMVSMQKIIGLIIVLLGLWLQQKSTP